MQIIAAGVLIFYYWANRNPQRKARVKALLRFGVGFAAHVALKVLCGKAGIVLLPAQALVCLVSAFAATNLQKESTV